MPLELTKRGNYFYVRGTVRGQSVYETTKITLDREEEAEAYRIRYEAKLLQRSVYGAEADVTFEEAAVMYCETARPSGTQRAMIIGREMADGSRSWNLIDEIGKTKLRDVNQSLLDKIARTRFAGRAPATIQRQLVTPVNAIMARAAKRGWCERRQFESYSSGQKRVRWITPDEAQSLVLHAAPHAKPLFVFLLGTGARLSEALELDWRDVNLTDAQCHFWDTKNGSARRARLTPFCIAALASLRHKSGPVFLTRNRKPYINRNRESGGQIRTALQLGAARRAGLTDITPHTLRHTWASWFYAVSKDLLLLKAEGGWKTSSQVERYAHLVPSRYEAGIRDFWGGDHPAIRAESVHSDFKERKNVL